MRIIRVSAVAAAATAVLALAACGGGTATGGSGGGNTKSTTLTYWASNQGTSLQDDQQVLNPQIAKFTKQTGIKVKFQVIPWTTLLTQITAATVSGQGPRRRQHRQHLVGLTPGHRRLPALHLVGHDTSRRLQPVPGRRPVGHRGGRASRRRPSRSTALAYGLYYNKAEFAAAGITSPPATWTEFVADAKKLTKAATRA